MPKPTKAERERMLQFNLFAQLGCIICKHFLGEFRPADVSHMIDGQRRKGHSITVPECEWHHRGVVPSCLHSSINPTIAAEEILGPSRARSPNTYRKRFGTDDELVALTNKYLEGVT